MKPIAVLRLRAAGAGGPGHLYWRIAHTTNNGNPSFTGFTSFHLYTSIGGANIAHSGAPSTDTAAEGSPNLANATDNTDSNAWLYPFESGANHWYQVRFASPVDVVEFGLQSCSNTATQAVTAMPKDMVFQWSDDGSTWIAAVTPTAQTGWSAGELRRFS